MISFSTVWRERINLICTVAITVLISFFISQHRISSALNMSSSTAATNTDEEKFTAVFVTAPDDGTAKKIANGLVEKKLAACVNIIPQILSIYSWEGKVNEDTEVLLMIKTRQSRVDDLTKFVVGMHPYSTPEVISLPIENGSPTYLDWISKTVPKSSST